MPFTPDTPETLETAQLAVYENRFPDKAVTSEDFLGKLASAEAQGLWTAQLRARRISLDAIPNEGSSYDALADWATALGLSNGAGGYGPKVAVPATGGVVQATGTDGSFIPTGTQLVGPDGVTLFATTADATIASGVASVNVDALTGGAPGNLAPPLALRFVSPPNGVQSSATITQALTGGANKEEKSDLLARVLDRLRNPPKPGTASHLRIIAEGVTGVARAYIYICREGSGTFDVYVVQVGSGAARASVPSDVLTAVRNAIAPYTVTTENITVDAPGADSGHALRVRCAPISLYPFDWDSSAGTWTVAGYNAGAKTLTLNVAAPADLFVGARIQVKTTGVVLPVIATVASITGGGTVLGFTSLPTEWGTNPPQIGNEVHAGSDFVASIAQAILDAVNALGPSLKSGFADTATDSWQDSLDPFQLARVALDVTDSAGRRFLSTLVAEPTIDGATTALEAADDLISAPQFLTASSILVTP